MKMFDFIGKTQRKDTKKSVAMPHDAAMKQRRGEFWHPVLKVFYTGYDKHPDAAIDVKRYNVVREHVLKALEEGAEEFAKGNCRFPLQYDTRRQLLEVVMFVCVFDVDFKYTPPNPEDKREPVDFDTLNGEAAFQMEVRSALDKYMLEGAKLAKKVGSASYATWTKAMIALADVVNARYEKSEVEGAIREVMQLVVAAQQQLWADVRVSAASKRHTTRKLL